MNVKYTKRTQLNIALCSPVFRAEACEGAVMVLAGASLLTGGGGTALARATVILNRENLENCHTLEVIPKTRSLARLKFKLVYSTVFG